MRNTVWIAIVIWVVWKIYNAFALKANKHYINSDNPPENEGEVKIDKNVKQKSHFSSNDGEYVDYEEVK